MLLAIPHVEDAERRLDDRFVRSSLGEMCALCSTVNVVDGLHVDKAELVWTNADDWSVTLMPSMDGGCTIAS